MSEYQERICLKCGKPFQEHFTMGSRTLCPSCYFEKSELREDKMHIIAELVQGKELRAGELFSTEGPEYWDHLSPDTIGEKVYIRTETACPSSQEEQPIYRISVAIVLAKR